MNAYSWGLILFLLMSIISGSFTLYALFHKNSQEAVRTCLNGATDDLTKTVCQNGQAVYKGIAVTLYIIIWLLMICAFPSFAWYTLFTYFMTISTDAYVIVDNYVDQLDEETSVKETRQMINAISQPQVTVQPVAVPTYASFGPAAQNTGYAFSHTNQSYGVRPNNSIV